MLSSNDQVFSLGIDIGLGHIRACALTDEGIRAGEVACRSTALGAQTILQSALWETVEPLVKRFPGRPVGIVSPFMVDVDHSCITRGTLRYPEWAGVPLKELAKERLGTPIWVDNAGIAAAYGEYCWGQARRADPFIALTLGSQIGGGIVLNGRILYGEGCLAGNLGHLPLMDDGPLCSCGNRGCLEALVSTGSIMNRARALGVALPTGNRDDATTIDHLANLARTGHSLLSQVFFTVGHDLGRGLAALANIVAPEIIVIGGSLATAWDLLNPGVEKALRAHLLYPDLRRLRIILSSHGLWAGAMGAASLAWHHYVNRISLAEREKTTKA